MSEGFPVGLRGIVRQAREYQCLEGASSEAVHNFLDSFIHSELEENSFYADLDEIDTVVSCLRSDLGEFSKAYTDIDLKRMIGQEIAWREEAKTLTIENATRSDYNEYQAQRSKFVDEALFGADPLTDKTSVSHHLGEMRKYFRSWADFPAFGFGIPRLDEATGGILPGEICVLTGAPGTMKTSLALSAVDDFVTRTTSGLVYYCTVDMSPREVSQRLMERECRVREAEIRLYSTSDDEGDKARYTALSQAVTGKYKKRLSIRGHTPSERMNITRLLHECLKRQPQLVIVDYLTRLKHISQSDLEFVEEAMPLIIEHAHRYETSFLLLSQMSRSSRTEQASGKMGGHGKGGGIVEELAHTEIELTQQPSEQQGEKPLVIAAITKARRGISGQYFSLDYEGQYKRFTGNAQKMRKATSATRKVFENAETTGFYS